MGGLILVANLFSCFFEGLGLESESDLGGLLLTGLLVTGTSCMLFIFFTQTLRLPSNHSRGFCMKSAGSTNNYISKLFAYKGPFCYPKLNINITSISHQYTDIFNHEIFHPFAFTLFLSRYLSFPLIFCFSFSTYPFSPSTLLSVDVFFSVQDELFSVYIDFNFVKQISYRAPI